MALILLAVYLEHVQMSEELKAALARIACLEGEIAKRDARIMGLESQYQRDVWGLNNEGDPIGGEPAGGYANDNARLRAELAAIKAQEPVAWPEGGSDAVEGAALGAFDSLGQPEHDLESWCAGYAEAVYAHAAPVSEAKAQGVAMPPPPYMPEVEPAQLTDYERGEAQGRCDMWAEVARLNAAPVQQVSVPVGYALVPIEPTPEMIKAALDKPCFDPLGDPLPWSHITRTSYAAMLAAAPAAPAADAGHVFYGMDGNHP